jgi:hypothetical protein
MIFDKVHLLFRIRIHNLKLRIRVWIRILSFGSFRIRIRIHNTALCHVLGEGEDVPADICICFGAILGSDSDHQTAALIQAGSLIQILGEVDIAESAPIVR